MINDWGIPLMESDSKDLKKKYEGDGHTYLFWPVKVGGHGDLHITAKYLGKLDIDPKEIAKAIEGIPTDVDVSQIEWEPVVFDTKNDGQVKVLQLVAFPENMKRIHDALEKFRKDDYDSYKPHITVPDELWNEVNDNAASAMDYDIEIDPLSLKVKGEPKEIGEWVIPGNGFFDDKFNKI